MPSAVVIRKVGNHGIAAIIANLVQLVTASVGDHSTKRPPVLPPADQDCAFISTSFLAALRHYKKLQFHPFPLPYNKINRIPIREAILEEAIRFNDLHRISQLCPDTLDIIQLRDFSRQCHVAFAGIEEERLPF